MSLRLLRSIILGAIVLASCSSNRAGLGDSSPGGGSNGPVVPGGSYQCYIGSARVGSVPLGQVTVSGTTYRWKSGEGTYSYEPSTGKMTFLTGPLRTSANGAYSVDSAGRAKISFSYTLASAGPIGSPVRGAIPAGCIGPAVASPS